MQVSAAGVQFDHLAKPVHPLQARRMERSREGFILISFGKYRNGTPPRISCETNLNKVCFAERRIGHETTCSRLAWSGVDDSFTRFAEWEKARLLERASTGNPQRSLARMRPKLVMET
jgi:hypothetical protein